MNVLSERAREIATKYMGSNCMEHCWCQYSEKNSDDYVSCEDKLVGLIEQALLAESRRTLEAVSARIEASANQHSKASVEYRILHYAAKEILQEAKVTR